MDNILLSLSDWIKETIEKTVDRLVQKIRRTQR
ncbi:phage protein [Streptococcus dysgalactiae]|nr:phage protein [Streptococcus dysgalactiae]